MNDPALWISIGLLGLPAVVFFVSWFRSNNPPPKSKLPTEKDLAAIQQRLQERTINILANRAETIDQPPQLVSPTAPTRSTNSGVAKEHIYFAPPIVSPYEKELIEKERELLQKERDLQDLRADIKAEMDRLSNAHAQQKSSDTSNSKSSNDKLAEVLLFYLPVLMAVAFTSGAFFAQNRFDLIGYAVSILMLSMLFMFFVLVATAMLYSKIPKWITVFLIAILPVVFLLLNAAP